MSRALAALAEDVEAILQRLERVEARLAAAEARLSLPEQTGEYTSETVGLDPGGGQDFDEAAPSLAERAQALGVDYARLRKLYSDEELRRLLGGGSSQQPSD